MSRGKQLRRDHACRLSLRENLRTRASFFPGEMPRTERLHKIACILSPVKCTGTIFMPAQCRERKSPRRNHACHFFFEIIHGQMALSFPRRKSTDRKIPRNIFSAGFVRFSAGFACIISLVKCTRLFFISAQRQKAYDPAEITPAVFLSEKIFGHPPSFLRKNSADKMLPFS